MINRISEFDVGINSLPNPNLISQFFAFSGIGKIYQVCNLWTWGALILALLASFTSVLNKLRFLIVRLTRRRCLPSPPVVEDFDFDTESDSSDYSSSDDEDQEEDTPSTSRDWRREDENFGVRGSAYNIGEKSYFSLRRRRGSIGDLFSLSELVAGGKSVVKLWDNLGLGFGLEFDDGDDSDVYDFTENRKIASFFRDDIGVQAVSKSSSPAVIVSAGADLSGRVALGAWDTRLPLQKPSIFAEWRPKNPAEKIASVNARSMEKVYVRDDVTGDLTVGDMRKVSSPVADLTESDMDTWWDADAVMNSDESK